MGSPLNAMRMTIFVHSSWKKGINCCFRIWKKTAVWQLIWKCQCFLANANWCETSESVSIIRHRMNEYNRSHEAIRPVRIPLLVGITKFLECHIFTAVADLYQSSRKEAFSFSTPLHLGPWMHIIQEKSSPAMVSSLFRTRAGQIGTIFFLVPSALT